MAVAQAATLPVNFPVELPPEFELVVAAAPPVVTFPIMGAFDDRGRLFVGDAAGLNLNRKALEERLPNRVLRLEDTDGDGVFDRSSVFADKMTFPQGACWLDGSLYVASPPGIWKLTDTNGDGVADQREMIVGGFDFDGNAADVHGPFLHPNGRLYWCHGRKGHKVVQKDGTLVHEGKASGIWSCRPDGSDVQWHSLGSMDNPVEVDFTPEGRIVGVVNLYYNQPRGDTLVHWLYGGAYERPDQLKVIADLPRTLEQMPVVHNFGHVAVSGFTRYRSGALNPAWKDNLFITFFNTQKVVRVPLTAAGATYQATENQFLKLKNPDAHFTDVIEDADGTLLVLDSGGWFRQGCPSSIAEKPDLRGAIYRVQRKGAAHVKDPFGTQIAWTRLSADELAKLKTDDSRWFVREKAMRLSHTAEFPMVAAADVKPSDLLDPSQPMSRLRSCEALAQAKQVHPAQRDALLAMLGQTLEPTLEHAAMFAAIATRAVDLKAVRHATNALLRRRLMVIVDRSAADAQTSDALLEVAKKDIDATDPDLARIAGGIIARNPRALDLCRADITGKLRQDRVSPGTVALIAQLLNERLSEAPAQELLTQMLQHSSAQVRQAAWRLLAGQSTALNCPAWLAPLRESLTTAIKENAGDLVLLLDATAKLNTSEFDATLQPLIKDATRPLPIRLRALGAISRAGAPLSDDAFTLLTDVLRNPGSTSARVDAARFLARARTSKEQLAAIAPLLSSVGVLELNEFLKIGRRLDAATGKLWAEQVVRSPAFASIPESGIRSAFSNLSPATYESILGPAARAISAAQDEKKRALDRLVAKASEGNASNGPQVFSASACVACHKAGSLGRIMGPDLSHIGQIRKPRDILESIYFPDATIARDYETHVVETSDGQTLTGTVKSDNADGLVLVELSGEERKVPQRQIVGHTTLASSLMPPGLEQSLSEQQLLDLVAWLTSLK